MDQTLNSTPTADQSSIQPISKKILAIIARLFAILLAIYTFYNLAVILGFKYIFSDYYYFHAGSGILTIIVFVVIFLTIFALIIYWARKKQAKTTAEPENKSKIFGIKLSYYIGLIIMFIVSYNFAKKPGYDIVYAYGSPQALSEISVQNQKIIPGSDGDYVIYYYNLRRGMSFQDWDNNGQYKTFYSPHEFPHSNLNKLNIKSDSLTAPDDSIATVNSNGKSCSIKVGNTILYPYESLYKYHDCKVIGWIKPLY